MHTPWGESDHSKQYAEGITFYGTPSHGGIKLSAARLAEMPDYLQLPGGWFEEDCDWCLVAIQFPEYFPAAEQMQALETLLNWYPEKWERFTGSKLQPGQSYKRDEQLFREAHREDYVVMAAFGDWHEKVPKGYVGCFAGRGGRTAAGQFPKDAKWFLVPEGEYAIGAHGFVIDPKRHQEIEAIG